VGARGRADRRFGGSGQQHLAQGGRDGKHLVHAGAPAVAGAAALRAALAALRGGLAQLLLADPEQRERPGARLVLRDTGAAGFAYQPLGDDQRERGGHQERLDAHVDEARDGADRVVGVQGREHQVTGEGGLQGELGGLLVADLADEHDVGVLAQHAAQAAGEGEA